MTEETFNALPFQQLYEGFIHCRKSAQAHQECARLMAEKEHYGLANSHLVLGAEEAIKGIIIFMKMGNDPLDIKSIEPIFRNHGAKHDQGYLLMLEVLKNKISGNGVMLLKRALNAIEKKMNIKDAMRYVAKGLFAMPSNIDTWWKKANAIKNEGFYVGHNNNTWIVPTAITRQQYLESRAQTDFLFEILSLGEFLENDFLQTNSAL